MGFDESKIITRKSVPASGGESFVNNKLEPERPESQKTEEQTYASVLSKTDLDVNDVRYLLDGIEQGKIMGEDIGLAAFKCQNSITRASAGNDYDALRGRVPQEAVREYLVQCVRDKIMLLAHSIRSGSLNDAGQPYEVSGDIDVLLRKGIDDDKVQELKKEFIDTLNSSLDEAFGKVVEKPSLDATKKLRSVAASIIRVSALMGDTKGWDNQSKLEELDNKLRGSN